tara:strand:+ start:220 stop:528 length:309 start_codon:yes stop_codon:yes gene_type:complete
MLDNNISSSEERFLRENQVTTSACRQLADWALAHFGERTSPSAYQKIIYSMSVTGPDFAVEKVFNDLTSQGYAYRREAVMRMYERFRRESQRAYDLKRDLAA